MLPVLLKTRPSRIIALFRPYKKMIRAAKTIFKDEDTAPANGATSLFYTRIRRTVILQAVCNQIRHPSNSYRVPCNDLVVSAYKTGKIFMSTLQDASWRAS